MPTEHPTFLGAGCPVLGLLSHQGGRDKPSTLTGAIVPLLCSLGTNTEEVTQEQWGF